jgi:hypothetical protein
MSETNIGGNKKKTEGENPYYKQISITYRHAKHIITALLITFILFMLAFFRSEITAENFRYLIESINPNSPGFSNESRIIYFDNTSQTQVGMYKGDLVVVNPSNVSLLNMLGKTVLQYNISYAKPVLSLSKQYMIVYSQGEYTYTVNNTFTRLFTETLDYPITGITSSDSGMYAVITKNLQYRSVVYIYDKNFNKISQILKDKLVLDVAFNNSGSELIITSVYNKDGDYRTEVITLNPSSNTPSSTNEFNDTYGIKAEYRSDGGFTLLCDNQLIFFNSKSEVVSTYEFHGRIPLKYYVGNEYTAVFFNENVIGNISEIFVFDKNGNIIYNETISGQIEYFAGVSSYIFALITDRIIMINLTDGTSVTTDIEAGAYKLLMKDDSSLTACYYQYVVTYDINDLFLSKGEI